MVGRTWTDVVGGRTDGLIGAMMAGGGCATMAGGGCAMIGGEETETAGAEGGGGGGYLSCLRKLRQQHRTIFFLQQHMAMARMMQIITTVEAPPLIAVGQCTSMKSPPKRRPWEETRSSLPLLVLVTTSGCLDWPLPIAASVVAFLLACSDSLGATTRL